MIGLLFVALAAAAGEPSPSPVVVGRSGTLDKEVIRARIRPRLAEVRACYESGLQRRNMEGVVKVQFVVEGSGAVSSARVVQSSLGDAAVEKCVCESVKRWSFPAPLGGGIVIVTYPFTLKIAP